MSVTATPRSGLGLGFQGYQRLIFSHCFEINIVASL